MIWNIADVVGQILSWELGTTFSSDKMVHDRGFQASLFNCLCINKTCYQVCPLLLTSASYDFETLPYLKYYWNYWVPFLSRTKFKKIIWNSLEKAPIYWLYYPFIVPSRLKTGIVYCNTCPRRMITFGRILSRSGSQLDSLSILYSIHLLDNDFVAFLGNLENSLYCNLQSINLAGCKMLSSFSLQYIVPIAEQLTEINLWGCLSLSDQGVNSLLRQATRLRKLNIGECRQLSDITLNAASRHCSLLEQLVITGCSGMENPKLYFPHLRKFSASYCKHLSSTAVCHLKHSCYLTTLNMLMDKDISPVTILLLAYQCSCLQSVNIGGWNKWTDVCTSELVNLIPNVSDLKLFHCSEIGDQSLLHLSQAHLPLLQYLDISYCPNLTDQGVSYLLESDLPLRKLDISGLPVSDWVVEGLTLHFPRLEKLECWGCRRLSEALRNQIDQRFH